MIATDDLFCMVWGVVVFLGCCFDGELECELDMKFI